MWPSAAAMQKIECRSKTSSVGFFAGSFPRNFPSKPIAVLPLR
jgi:hypothetical protein